MFYVYILECSDGSYYTGYTNNLDKRLEQHQSGKGARYTKGRLPVELVHFEEFESRGDAMRREREIKRFNRSKKENLVRKYTVI